MSGPFFKFQRLPMEIHTSRCMRGGKSKPGGTCIQIERIQRMDRKRQLSIILSQLGQGVGGIENHTYQAEQCC